MKYKDLNSFIVSSFSGSFKIIIGILCIVFIGNINALIDLFLHPEIPYFDLEHIIVGLTSSFFIFIFSWISFQYIRRLNNINIERHSLIVALFNAKDKAEKNEKLLINSQKTAHLGHWNWDLQKQELTWSDEIFNIFGREKESFQVTTENFESTIHPNDLENFLHVRNEALKIGDEVNIAHRIVKPDGEIRYVQELSKIIRNEEKLPVCVFGTVQDVTKLKLAEIALIEAKTKAVENDRLKTAFLQNISHEIRTPMNGIIGFSGLLSNSDVENEKQEQYIEIIKNCSYQLLRIIDDIVDISKIESNQIKIKYSPVYINALLKNLHALLLQRAKQTNIDFSFVEDLNDNDCMVLTDESRLRQILINLINNAFKFILKGHVKFGYVVKGDLIEFFVEDTGIGIPQNMQERIFERFVQVENSLAKSTGGTGLGLSISKGLVELLGGKIWLISELEKSTTFYFTIPFKQSIDLIDE